MELFWHLIVSKQKYTTYTETELFEMKLFWHLIVSKQKYTHTKLNCLKWNCFI